MLFSNASLFSLCAYALAWSEIFFLCCTVSRIVSLAKIIKHTRIFQIIFEISPFFKTYWLVCLPVCVCARAHTQNFFLTVFWFFVMGYVLQFGEIAHEEYIIIILKVWKHVNPGVLESFLFQNYFMPSEGQNMIPMYCPHYL